MGDWGRAPKTPLSPSHPAAAIRSAIKEPVGRRVIRWIKANAPDWIPQLTRQCGKREERLFRQSGGGYDRNVTEPRTLETMIAYVHENPVRKGLVERTADWTWSSAAWFVEGTEPPIPVDPIPPEWTAPPNE